MPGKECCGSGPNGTVSKADRRTAIEKTLRQVKPGDVVLIAGKGHEQFQVVGGEQLEFDDRQIAQQWLYESPAIDKLYRASA